MIEYKGAINQLSAASYFKLYEHTSKLFERLICKEIDISREFCFWLNAKGVSRQENILSMLYRAFVTSDSELGLFLAEGYQEEEINILRELMPLGGEKYWSEYIPRICKSPLAARVKILDTEFKLFKLPKKTLWEESEEQKALHFLHTVLIQMACEWGYERKVISRAKKNRAANFVDIDMFEGN